MSSQIIRFKKSDAWSHQLSSLFMLVTSLTSLFSVFIFLKSVYLFLNKKFMNE